VGNVPVRKFNLIEPSAPKEVAGTVSDFSPISISPAVGSRLAIPEPAADAP